MLARNASVVNPKTGKAVKVYRWILSVAGDRYIAVVSLKDFEDLTGVRLCTDHTGKMSGIVSVSTSVTKNPLCAIHAAEVSEDGEHSVCYYCYAATMAAMYKNLAAKNEQNDDILKHTLLDFAPLLPCLQFRFEAFGDLGSVKQVINYLNIAKANPSVRCALWTKNPLFLAAAFRRGAKKPKNFNIGVSSLFLNTPARLPEDWESWIDFYFTVYTAEYLAAHRDIKINCGGLSCLACGRCYTYDKARNGHGEILIVNELLKSDKAKAKKLGLETFYD